MTAMMIDDGKRVAAGGARLQWHMIPIADIDLIARNTRGEENGVTSTAEENAIRRQICVVSRIRDAEYGLVAHGNLAAPAATATTPRGLMHRSLLRRANVGYGGPRAAYDA